jgi:hypothetical protein
LAERNTKMQAQSGKFPGSLFAPCSAANMWPPTRDRVIYAL